jgi:hypothetical protein
VIKFTSLLAQGRWFSPGIPSSSTTKTGRHDIAEILLKVALSTKNQNQITTLPKRVLDIYRTSTLKQLIASPEHIILIPSQPICAFSP